MIEIKNDEDLRRVVAQVSEGLQAIQDYVGGNQRPDAKVRFPRGFIRTAEEIRRQLPAVGPDLHRRNISYAIIMNDLLRWLLLRTDIFGTAKGMVIKEAICLMASLCETFTKDALAGKIGDNKGFKDRTAMLAKLQIIDAALKKELDWLWDKRQNEHLFLAEQSEHEHYTAEDYNKAFRAYDGLREKLKANFG